MNRTEFKMLNEDLENMIQFINSPNAKAKYKELLKKYKSFTDKAVMYSYYDIRFAIPNEKLLLEELKANLKNKNKQTLMYVFLPNLMDNYYKDSEAISKMIVEVKSLLKINMPVNLAPLLLTSDYYFYNNCLIFYCETAKAKKVYKRLKAIFKKVEYSHTIKFVELEKDRYSKPLKIFDDSYKKVLELINNDNKIEKDDGDINE